MRKEAAMWALKSKNLVFLIICNLLPALTVFAAPVKYQLDDTGLVIEGVSGTNPIIYDNDWFNDTTDHFYLWAKASLGRANLRGTIVSRDMWGWQKGYLYKLQQGMETARKAVDIARRSGLKNIPAPVAGCDRVFVRPQSGKIEETKVVISKGGELIVAEAKKASPEKPLLVFVGGPLNTVANAYLMDTSIAERMIVFMTDLRGYNGKDKWANYIVAKRCKLVNYGAHIWWPQRPQPPVMPLERFDDLPKNELTEEMFRIAKMFWDRSTRKDNPVRDDGFGDGAPVFLVFDPKTWTQVQPQKVTGVFELKDVAATEGFDLLDARDCNYSRMSKEFFVLMKNARVYGANRPENPHVRAAFPLKVSDNHRYLVDKNNHAFLIHGDTPWEIAWRLTKEEALTHMD